MVSERTCLAILKNKIAGYLPKKQGPVRRGTAMHTFIKIIARISVFYLISPLYAMDLAITVNVEQLVSAQSSQVIVHTQPQRLGEKAEAVRLLLERNKSNSDVASRDTDTSSSASAATSAATSFVDRMSPQMPIGEPSDGTSSEEMAPAVRAVSAAKGQPQEVVNEEIDNKCCVCSETFGAKKDEEALENLAAVVLGPIKESALPCVEKVTLGCNHSFCVDCLGKTIMAEEINQETKEIKRVYVIKCPVCRFEQDLDELGRCTVCRHPLSNDDKEPRFFDCLLVVKRLCGLWTIEHGNRHLFHNACLDTWLSNHKKCKIELREVDGEPWLIATCPCVVPSEGPRISLGRPGGYLTLPAEYICFLDDTEPRKSPRAEEAATLSLLNKEHYDGKFGQTPAIIRFLAEKVSSFL